MTDVIARQIDGAIAKQATDAAKLETHCWGLISRFQEGVAKELGVVPPHDRAFGFMGEVIEATITAAEKEYGPLPPAARLPLLQAVGDELVSSSVREVAAYIRGRNRERAEKAQGIVRDHTPAPRTEWRAPEPPKS